MTEKTYKILKWFAYLILAGFICFVGCFIALIIWVNMGCGMDDRPFEAVLINQTAFSDNHEVFDLTNNGKLFIDNRNDTLSPTITLYDEGKVQWTLDMNTKNTEGYERTYISELVNIKVIKNSNPIKLNFTGIWTYGAESGNMSIDRYDGDNSFCLSW